MATRNAPNKIPGKLVTPLWIIAAFVSLTETAAMVAVTQVQGGAQIALEVFVMGFATLVATAFFAVLWFRPYVFYSPNDYGDKDPKEFIGMLRDLVPERLAVAIADAEAKPDDHFRQFVLIDSLIEPAARQHLIMMRKCNTGIPLGLFHFATGGDGVNISGNVMAEAFAKELAGTGLVTISDNREVVLTDEGKDFADWLLKSLKQYPYYKSDSGSWDNRPDARSPNKT